MADMVRLEFNKTNNNVFIHFGSEVRSKNMEGTNLIKKMIELNNEKGLKSHTIYFYYKTHLIIMLDFLRYITFFGFIIAFITVCRDHEICKETETPAGVIT